MSSLFDPTKVESENSIHWSGEASLSWLGRQAGEPMASARRLIDKWFSDWPEDASKADLRARLSDKNAQNAHGALFELMLFGVLRARGCAVAFGSTAADTTAVSMSKPDFHVQTRDGSMCILEAKTLLWDADRERKDETLRRLSRELPKHTTHRDYAIWVDEFQPGTQQESAKSVAKAIDAFIHLHPESLKASLQDGGHPFVVCETKSGLRLKGQIIRRPWASASPSELFLCYGTDCEWSKSCDKAESTIRDALKQHQGHRTASIVAITSLDTMDDLDSSNILHALIGKPVHRFRSGETQAPVVRRDGGVWNRQQAGASWRPAAVIHVQRVAFAWAIPKAVTLIEPPTDQQRPVISQWPFDWHTWDLKTGDVLSSKGKPIRADEFM